MKSASSRRPTPKAKRRRFGSQKAGEKYYQLTHDYLVHSLRDWLTRKQKETRRGRAELAAWQIVRRSGTLDLKPGNYPRSFNGLSIRLLTGKKNWTEPQRTMMRSAARHHGLCWGMGLVLAITLGITLQQYIAANRLENDTRRAESLVEAVLTAPADARSLCDPEPGATAGTRTSDSGATI